MATTRKEPSQPSNARRAPARTPEDEEAQMIALAFAKVRERMIAGEATAQEYVHFMKLGSSREEKEQRRLDLEAQLAMKKMEALESAKRIEELYEGAIRAMRSYGGDPSDDSYDPYDEM